MKNHNKESGTFSKRSIACVIVLVMSVVFAGSANLYAGRPTATAMTAASYDDIAYYDNLYFAANRWGIEVFEIVNDTQLVSLSRTHTRGRAEFLDAANGLLAASNIDGMVELFYIDGKTLKRTGSIDVDYHPVGVKLINNYLYVGGVETSLTIYDISNPRFPEERGAVNFEGYPHDFTIRNDTLFVAAYQGGVVLLDISDPQRPTFLQQYDLGSYVYGIALDGSYIYTCAHSSGLVVLDMASQNMPPVIGYNAQFGSARKAIMTEDGLLVLDGFGAVSMMDISNPTQPQYLWGQSLDFNSNDFILKDNYLTVANWNNGIKLYRADLKSGLQLLDEKVDYSVCRSVAVSNGRVLAGVGTGGILAYDYNLNPFESDESPAGENCLEVKIANRYAFLSDDANGVSIVDISNPDDFKLVSTFHSRGWVKSSACSGDVLYLANWQGIAALDISNIDDPVEINFLDTEDGTSKIDYRNDTLFVAGSGGLDLYNVTNPVNMIPVGHFETHYPATSIELDNDLIFLSSGLGGVDIMTLSNGPRLVSHIDARDHSFAADYQDGRLFVAEGYAGIAEWDLSDIDRPVLADSFLSTGQAVDVKLLDDRLYVADYYGVTMFEVGINERNYDEYAELSDRNHMKISAYPNPVNGGSRILFDLKRSGNVEVSLYDILGRKVKTVYSGFLQAGNNSFPWDGHGVASGCYFINVAGNGFTSSKQVTIIK